MRDAFVALQSCASNFLPGPVRRERRSDRGSDLCAWSLKVCRQAPRRRLNPSARFQACQRKYWKDGRTSRAFLQDGEFVSPFLAF